MENKGLQHQPRAEGRYSPPSRSCGVYVHVPFCRRRCPYCDFYFEVGRPQDGYVDALLAELEARWPEGPQGGTLAETLSFGGGTPTQLSSASLATIVAAVRKKGLTEDAEISLEANPEDLDDDVIAGLKDAGITRVSVGVQSFQDAELRYLGRAHDGDRARTVVAALVAAGFSVGVDLIVGVPNERPSRVVEDVVVAAGLGVHHLSTYVLTLEPETPLVQLIKRGTRAPIDDQAQADAYEGVVVAAADAGYVQYEVSSHARDGQVSRHNRLYWQRGDYLGLGPGAHSFHLDGGGHAIRRHTVPNLDAWRTAWLSGAADADVATVVDSECLEPAHSLREAVAFGLRDLWHGVDIDALAAWHQVDDAAVLGDIVAALEAARQRGEVRHTPAGMLRDVVEVADVVEVVDDAGGSNGALAPDRAVGLPRVADGGIGRYHLTSTGARFADRVARDVLSSP